VEKINVKSINRLLEVARKGETALTTHFHDEFIEMLYLLLCIMYMDKILMKTQAIKYMCINS